MSKFMIKRKKIEISAEDLCFIDAWIGSEFVHAPTKELRKFVSRSTKQLYYRRNSIWKNRPPDWPADILFKDPNNGGPDRPKQKDLSKMAVFLANQLQLAAGILNLSESEIFTIEKNALHTTADSMNSTEMMCLLESDSSAMIALNPSVYGTSFVAALANNCSSSIKTSIVGSQAKDDIDVYEIFKRVSEKYKLLMDKKIISECSNDSLFVNAETVLRDASDDWCDIMDRMHKLEQVMDCYLMKKNANSDLKTLLLDLKFLVNKKYRPLREVINDSSVEAIDAYSTTKIESPPLNVRFDVSLQANTAFDCEVALREFEQDLMQVTGVSDCHEELECGEGHFDDILDFINAHNDDSVNNSITGELYLDSLLSSNQSVSSSTSEKLDSLLDGKMVRTLSCDTDTVLKRLYLSKDESPADGSCILRSWEKTTGMSVYEAKLAILDEYQANSPLYCERGVVERELRQYLDDHQYDSGTVDSIPEILVNVTGKTLYILENRFADNNTPTRITKISVVSEKNCCDGSVFLLKTGDHYDALLDSTFGSSEDIT